ncbi:MAG TPA: hypothetical protein VIC59_04645 [Gemmatimonadota bacterium]
MQAFVQDFTTASSTTRDNARRWNVEIHLSPGGIVRERTSGEDWRDAVESALARSRIVAGQVSGIVAYPIPGAA